MVTLNSKVRGTGNIYFIINMISCKYYDFRENFFNRCLGADQAA